MLPTVISLSLTAPRVCIVTYLNHEDKRVEKMQDYLEELMEAESYNEYEDDDYADSCEF